MSNPLIRPGDPRFQRPPIADETGANRFADDAAAQPPAAEQPSGESVFSSPQPSSEPSYQPQYATGQPSRQRLIFTLGGSSLAALGAAAIAIWMQHWITYPLLVVALPTAAVGWYTAADELSVIRQGGVPAKHRTAARLGLGLTILCVLLTLGLAYAAIQTRVGLGE